MSALHQNLLIALALCCPAVALAFTWRRFGVRSELRPFLLMLAGLLAVLGALDLYAIARGFVR